MLRAFTRASLRLRSHCCDKKVYRVSCVVSLLKPTLAVAEDTAGGTIEQVLQSQLAKSRSKMNAAKARIANWRRRHRLLWLRLRVRVAGALGKVQPFTEEQFLADCLQLAGFVGKAVQGMIPNATFRLYVIDKPEPIARARKIPGQEYYEVHISKPSLLVPCYRRLAPKVRALYLRHRDAIDDVTLDLFVRMTLSCSVLMALWHESAHVLRGHLDYKIQNERLPTPDWTSDIASYEAWYDKMLHPLLPERTIELDADIFGAQFMVGHVMHTSDVFPSMRRHTFAMAASLGIRGLFEYLGEGERHDRAPESTHPHPLTRAYVAFTHAFARLSEMGLSAGEVSACTTIGQTTLLEFETVDLGFRIDPVELERFQTTELQIWSRRHADLTPYQPSRTSGQRKGQ